MPEVARYWNEELGEWRPLLASDPVLHVGPGAPTGPEELWVDTDEETPTGGGAASWDDLTGKPTTFPPTEHQHAVADVTGLSTRLTALESDSGLRNLTSLFGLTSGAAYLHVKGGWCWLVFQNAQLAGTGNVVLTSTGLASVCPQAPVASAEGLALTATNAFRRVEVNRNGQARIFGATTGDVLNGTTMWPMTRTTPATWPGSAV